MGSTSVMSNDSRTDYTSGNRSSTVMQPRRYGRSAGLPIKLNLVSWTSPFIKDNARALAVHGWTSGEYLSVYLSAIVLFSLILGVFNLLPIAPLDGFKVALGFLPRDLSIEFAKLERYGLVILFSLFFVVPLLTGKFLLFEIMSPIIRVLAWLFAGTSGDPFV